MFATCEVRMQAGLLAAMLVLLLFGINGLNVLNSYVGRDFMTAIEQRDREQAWRTALFYVGVFGLSTIAAVMYSFAEQRLGLLWRDWLTRRLVGLYLGDRMYYRMRIGEELANPDQRIADDVRSFTTSTLSIALIFLNSALTLVAFSGVLWSISGTLFAVAVGYAAVGSLTAVWLGRPLVRLNYDQSDREAGFRAALVGVREEAELIALADGEPHLRSRLLRQVDGITSNLKRIVAVNRNLGFFTTGYNYMIQLIPVFVVAPLFMSGRVEFGVIAQSTMAFAFVLGAFSLIVNQFPTLSSYAAVVARLSALIDAMDEAAKRRASPLEVVEDDRHLAFERLTLLDPHDGHPLVRDLSMRLDVGSRLLVRCPADTTVALLRAVAGLWETGQGRVVRPVGHGVLVLPEEPWLPPGTLRELLLGGGGARVPDDDIRAALHALDVDGMVRRVGSLDVELGRDALSLQEKRLVEVTRALLAAPRFVLLPHFEDSLGIPRGGEALAALAARGIGYLVIGDVTFGPEHFDGIVEIAPDGTWTQTATQEGAA
jgi:putative ATP-binding cassette transporter